MNEDLKLKKDYKDTFSDIHAPEALARKVKNMSKVEKSRAGMSLVKKLAVSAAAVAILFAGSNGVAYAATGSTWIETVVIHFNGSEYEAEMNGEVGEDAVTYTVTDEQETSGTVNDLTEETPWVVEEYNVTP